MFPGSPALPDGPRAQDYDMAKQLLSEAGYPDGLDITLTHAKYLENPQYAQLIQEQCKPAGINVKLDQLSYEAYYAGDDADYYGTTPWINAAMTITEWGSRPAPGIYAAAMLLPDAVWSSSHWNNPEWVGLFDQYQSTADEASRIGHRRPALEHPAGRHADPPGLLHHPAPHAEEERVRHPGPRARSTAT